MLNNMLQEGSEESADQWLQYFRKKARNEIEFQFLFPRGLNISTPGTYNSQKGFSYSS